MKNIMIENMFTVKHWKLNLSHSEFEGSSTTTCKHDIAESSLGVHALRKQFWIASAVIEFQAAPKFLVVSKMFHFGISFPRLIASTQAQTNRCRKFLFTRAIIPCSNGWSLLVKFGGKKCTLTFDSFKSLTLWALQLSFVSEILWFCLIMRSLKFSNHFLNATVSIQGFF